ncbi:hypothetical protein TNCV_1561961 [Trichonephila clavipes]|nr:hypothetical protein TNCV_1561961 [Trichonephila clavipes]
MPLDIGCQIAARLRYLQVSFMSSGDEAPELYETLPIKKQARVLIILCDSSANILRKTSACVSELGISVILHKFLEESRESRTRQHGHQSRHIRHQLGHQHDSNSALSQKFR